MRGWKDTVQVYLLVDDVLYVFLLFILKKKFVFLTELRQCISSACTLGVSCDTSEYSLSYNIIV